METDLPPVVPSPFFTGEPKNNTLAIVSLGLGIAGFPFLCLSVVLAFCGCFSGLLGIAAVVTGLIARQQIQANGENGNGIAIAGMIMGGVQIVLVICGVCFSILLVLVPAAGEIFSGMVPGLK